MYWTLVSLLISGVLLLGGCGDSDTERRGAVDLETREFWIRNFQRSLAAKTYVGEDASRVTSLVAELRSGAVTVPPRLLSVAWGIPREGDEGNLALTFYDEDGVISAIRVREYTADGEEVIMEDYEVYPGGRGQGPWGDSIVVSFQPRTMGQVKDARAWQKYAEKNVRRRELLPAIWISLPSRSRQVVVSLVASSGTETRRLELEPQESQNVSKGEE